MNKLTFDKMHHFLDGEPLVNGDVLYLRTDSGGEIAVLYEWSGGIDDRPTFRFFTIREPAQPNTAPDAYWGERQHVNLETAEFRRSGRISTIARG